MNINAICNILLYSQQKKIRKGKKPVPRGPCGELFEKDPTKRKGNVDIDGKEYI